ncbi:hypothetical protein MTR_0912s0020 [Medicago truncatula]|uniref:Cysteine-rich receptor-like protein kinase n=1 Tax=Medicago truncatula TaxID=3880 RepID=A0A072TDN1_MEDTR|nr:hypothetical protein MTR_0912s0020 [Medicago truncatula]
MLVDRSVFWYRVLVARYGEVGGRLEVGGRSCSSWWREVGRIRDGGGDYGGGWFGECVSKKLGDGSDTLFWYDKWLGSVSFCERFPRLFDVSENKSISVAGVGVEEEVVGLEEEELEEYRALLTDVSLQDITEVFKMR